MSNPNIISPYGTQNVTWGANDQPTITMDMPGNTRKALELQQYGELMASDYGLEQMRQLGSVLQNPFSFSAPQGNFNPSSGLPVQSPGSLNADTSSGTNTLFSHMSGLPVQATNPNDPYGYAATQRAAQFGNYNNADALLQQIQGDTTNTPRNIFQIIQSGEGNTSQPGTWAELPGGGTRFTPANGVYQNSPNMTYGFNPTPLPGFDDISRVTGADINAGRYPAPGPVNPTAPLITPPRPTSTTMTPPPPTTQQRNTSGATGNAADDLARFKSYDPQWWLQKGTGNQITMRGPDGNVQAIDAGDPGQVNTLLQQGFVPLNSQGNPFDVTNYQGGQMFRNPDTGEWNPLNVILGGKPFDQQTAEMPNFLKQAPTFPTGGGGPQQTGPPPTAGNTLLPPTGGIPRPPGGPPAPPWASGGGWSGAQPNTSPIDTSPYGSQSSFNESGIAPMPVSPGMTGQNAIMSRLGPEIARNRQSTETQLINQGLRPGMQAYDTAMNLLGQQENDLLTQAGLQGLNLDMSARQQGFGEAQSRAGFYNQAQQQNLSNRMNAQQAYNAAQQQRYNQALQGGQFANSAQAQAFAQALTQRELPLNEILAVSSGAQVQSPQYQPYQGVNVAPAPVFQGTQAQGAWDQNVYNQQVAQANAMRQGLFSLGGSILGGAGQAGGFRQMFCWIAEALYGEGDSRVNMIRTHLLGPFSKHYYGQLIVWVYRKTGRQIAYVARRSSLLRSILRPLFDAILKAAIHG